MKHPSTVLPWVLRDLAPQARKICGMRISLRAVQEGTRRTGIEEGRKLPGIVECKIPGRNTGGENGERKVERRKHKGTGMKNEGRNIRPLAKGG